MSAPTSSPQHEPEGLAKQVTTAAAGAIKEEFITQRLKSWLAQSYPVSLEAGLSKLSAMSVDSVDGLPQVERGMTIPHGDGSRFVPFNDHGDVGLELKSRIEQLRSWSINPVNLQMLYQVEALLLAEVREKVWQDDSGNLDSISNMNLPSRINQYSVLCAKERLLELSINSDLDKYINKPSNDPNTNKLATTTRTSCPIGVCRLDDSGQWTIHRMVIPLSASLGCFDWIVDVNFNDLELKGAVSHLLERLKRIQCPLHAASQVKVIKEEVAALGAQQDSAQWVYKLCKQDTPKVDPKNWEAIKDASDFREMVQAAMKGNFMPLVAHQWQNQLHQIVMRVQSLERKEPQGGYSIMERDDDSWDEMVLHPSGLFHVPRRTYPYGPWDELDDGN